MKSIKVLFEKVKYKYPDWGDYICLAEAVTGRKYRGDMGILINFFVNANDYARGELTGLISHLKKLTDSDIVCRRKKKGKSSRRDFYAKSGNLPVSKKVG